MSEQATMQQPSPDEQPQENKQERQQQQGAGGRSSGRRRRHPSHSQQQQAGAGGQQQRGVGPALNMDELRDLVQLIAEHGFTDFELEREGFRVRLRRELAPQIINAPGTAAQQLAQTSVSTETKAATLKRLRRRRCLRRVIRAQRRKPPPPKTKGCILLSRRLSALFIVRLRPRLMFSSRLAAASSKTRSSASSRP